jgi:hypothetical protein
LSSCCQCKVLFNILLRQGIILDIPWSKASKVAMSVHGMRLNYEVRMNYRKLQVCTESRNIHFKWSFPTGSVLYQDGVVWVSQGLGKVESGYILIQSCSRDGHQMERRDSNGDEMLLVVALERCWKWISGHRGEKYINMSVFLLCLYGRTPQEDESNLTIIQVFELPLPLSLNIALIPLFHPCHYSCL